MKYDFADHLKDTNLDITNTQRLMIKEQELLKQQQEQQHQADCDDRVFEEEGMLDELKF